MKNLLLISFNLLVFTFVRGQSVVYYCDFDSPSDTVGWVLENGLQPNRWTIDNDGSMGSNALYITNLATTVNYYDLGAGSLVYAHRRVALSRGVYRFSFDWRCAGENHWDYMRAFLAPDHASLLAGTPPDGMPSFTMLALGTPEGWISLDGGKQLYQITESAIWTTRMCEASVSVSDTYKLVFVWVNDGLGGTQPPAAVDNIVIERPACPAPLWPYVDRLTPTSFCLHWTDLSMGNASEWLVELDSATQTLGQGTLFNSYDTLISFIGLEPNTDYTMHIRQVCGADTLDTLVSVWAHTLCNLIDTLPYRQDFDTIIHTFGFDGVDDLPCWFQWGGNCYISTNEEEDRFLYWVAEPGNRVVLPGIDRRVLSTDTLQLSFRGRNYNGNIIPLEIGVMTDPADDETFEMVDTLTIIGSDWQRYVVELTPYTGVGGYIALRIATTGSTRCFIDDVVIGRISPCQSVTRLSASHTGTTGTLLEWDVVESLTVEPDSFQVWVERVDPGATPGNMLRIATTEPRCLLTGLASHADYRAMVRVHCSNDSLSQWDSVRFTTLQMPCALPDSSAADTSVCGTGIHLVSGVPIRYDYNNTLCQSIYTADELLGLGMTAGMIVGMDYTFTNNVFDRSFSIYITATERYNYASEATMSQVRPQDLVYGPADHPAGTQGTVHHPFSQPFWWDGESNIAVTTLMNVGSDVVQASLFYGYSTQAVENRTISRYQNEGSFTPANSLSGNFSISSYRPSVTFYAMACAREVDCMSPTLWVDSVGEDAAVLAWSAGYNDTCWRMLYRMADDSSILLNPNTGWTMLDTHVVGNNHRLTSLAPAHQYQVRLEHICGGDTLYDLVVFTTQCATIDTLPFVEGFENFVAPAVANGPIQQCWYRSSRTSPPYVSSDYAYEGTRSLHLSGNSLPGYAYIALPAMGMDMEGLQLAFRAYATDVYRLKVGVMTDPTDHNTFAQVAEVTPTVLYDWVPVELPLAAYTGAGRHIALMIEGIQVRGVYVDNLRVDYLPNCLRPHHVAARRVTPTTATITWQGNNALAYEVEYGLHGFAHGRGTVVACTDDSLLLTDLSHSTLYDVYVRSLCECDTSDWSFLTTLHTACGIIDSLPYTKNFLDERGLATLQPTCWTCGSDNTQCIPSIINRMDSMGHTVGRMLRMPSRGSYRSFAMLPPLDDAAYPLDTLQLVIKAASDSSATAHLRRRLIVGVCSTTDIYASFTPVDTLDIGEVPTIYEVPLAAAVGAGNRITLLSEPTVSLYDPQYIYLDSVAIELLPSCQRPIAFHATQVTTTTATLTWIGRGAASQWQVEYMPQGVAIGAGTRILSGSTSITLTGLLPATAYDCYVRSVCRAADTSQWTLAPASFFTQQLPASVPYHYNFDTLSEWDNWQTLSNTTAAWYRGSADGQTAPSMYVSADNGATRGTLSNLSVNAITYRDIDFGSLDTSFILSFSASVGGSHSSSSSYEGLAVFLVDPVVPFTTSSNHQYQSPWGPLDSLTLLAHIWNTNGWRDYSIIIDSLTGINRLVFYWYNPVLSPYGYHSFVEPPAAVDNISIRFATCPRPTQLRATDLSASTASITWRCSPDDDYHVVLLTLNGTQVSSDTVHTNSIHYTGLLPATAYKMYVNRLCSTAPSGQTPYFFFSTDVCFDGVSDTIVSPSHSSSDEMPLRINYPYSYTQQLVSASELHGEGEISSINFYYTGSRTLTAKDNCTIYLGHTTRNSFTSVSDFVSPDLLQPVYAGFITCTRGWNRIFLDSPFPFNGTDNLVIAVDDNSGEPQLGSYHFDVVGTDSLMTLSFFSETDDVDCSSSSTLGDFGGHKQLYNYRSTMSFDFCPTNHCAPPSPYPAEVHVDSVVLRWQGSSDRYLVGYRLLNQSHWIEDNIPLTDTFYTIGRSLYFDTEYLYHVRQYCDSGRISNWAFGTFNTSDIPCLPPAGLRATAVTDHDARLTWTPDGNHISYRVHIWNSAFDTILTTYTVGCRVRGLNAASHYHAAVRVNCQYHDQPSRWSDTISFTTLFCPDATDLAALQVYGNSVLLDWQCDEGPVEWLIEWGLQGFDQGTGITVTAPQHPYLLTGLTGETSYDIYVRSLCGDNFVSEDWSNRLTVTTEYSGIGGVADGQRVQLTPNPTCGDMQLILPAGMGSVRVEVLDMAGRTLQTYTLPAHTERTTLGTSQLPQGAYYVGVTGGCLRVVKKALKIER